MPTTQIQKWYCDADEGRKAQVEQGVDRLEKEYQDANPDLEAGEVKKKRFNWYKSVRQDLWSKLTEKEQEQQLKKKAEESCQVPTEL